MAVNMKVWVVIAILITPWFWSLPVPKNLFAINLGDDIKEARSITVWERGKIAPSPVDKLFVNWIGVFINRRLSILMENLDIGNYFFAGHPRERVGVEERQKFFFFEFILFLIGLTSPNLKKYGRFLIIYSLIALLAVFIFRWRTFEQTLPLAVPLIVVIALGLEKTYQWLQR